MKEKPTLRKGPSFSLPPGRSNPKSYPLTQNFKFGCPGPLSQMTNSPRATSSATYWTPWPSLGHSPLSGTVWGVEKNSHNPKYLRKPKVLPSADRCTATRQQACACNMSLLDFCLEGKGVLWWLKWEVSPIDHISESLVQGCWGR